MLSKIKFDLSEDNSPVIVADFGSSEDLRDKVAQQIKDLITRHSQEYAIVKFKVQFSYPHKDNLGVEIASLPRITLQIISE